MRNFKVEVRGAASAAAGQLQARTVLGLDEVDFAASGLVANTAYTLYGRETSGGFSAIMTVTSDANGKVPEALAFVRFFDNWTAAVLVPPRLGPDPLRRSPCRESQPGLAWWTC